MINFLNEKKNSYCYIDSLYPCFDSPLILTLCIKRVYDLLKKNHIFSQSKAHRMTANFAKKNHIKISILRKNGRQKCL